MTGDRKPACGECAVRCSRCGAALCHIKEDSCRVFAHYAVGNEAYCVDCWDTSRCRPKDGKKEEDGGENGGTVRS